MFEKIVVVTRQTRLQGLIGRFATRGQAKFYLKQAQEVAALQRNRVLSGEDAEAEFRDYDTEDASYRQSLETLMSELENCGLKIQSIERELLPTFQFSPEDIVVVLGQDGLVANAAKYVKAQPLIGVNPDPTRFDGILLPFLPGQVAPQVNKLLRRTARMRAVTLAEAALDDGQRLLAFNDLFLGAVSHVSARYKVRWEGHEESHSSSGVIVSTGAGSTGWLSSVFRMAAGVGGFLGGLTAAPERMNWKDPRLCFVVREPFTSRFSQSGIVAGMIGPGQELELESAMPHGGVIFSDGVEADRLEFNSGAIARVRAAQEKTMLVVNS